MATSSNFAIYPSLKDKVVLVTGGASGIGAEIVKAFDAQGSKIGYIDLNREAAEALNSGLDSKPAFEHCDLRDIPALKTAFKSLQDKLGPADVLVNNAAHDDRHDWREVTPEYFDERFATNFRHQFFAIQCVAPGMIEKGTGGSIINFGSNSWIEKSADLSVYGSAKSAAHGLTRTMARELGPHRIRVNAIVPGWVMTQRQKDLWVTPEALEQLRAKQCLPDLIEPVYLARMALFLASDDSAMCSANSYMVEAGSI